MDAVIAQFINVTIMASALPLVLRGLGMATASYTASSSSGAGGGYSPVKAL